MKVFEVGKRYTTRSTCDYDCIFGWTVISRTAKTLMLKEDFNIEIKRHRIHIYNGGEHCRPNGSYSMAPCINA